MREAHTVFDTDTYDTIVDIEHIHNNCNYYSLSAGFHLEQGFSILHVNARSLKNKMDSFLTFLGSSGVEWSVICVSETWLKSDILSYFTIQNYDLFASCREGSEGGGTAVYVSGKLNAKLRGDLTAANNENTFVEIQINHKKVVKNIVVGAIYRPPASSDIDFVNDMEQVLQKLADEKKFTALAGDFNYDMLKEFEDRNVQNFCNLLSSYGFTGVISKPTRVTRDHSSLIDNIFINEDSFFQTSGIVIEDLSDHFPVFVNLKFKQGTETKNLPKQVFDMRKVPELNEYIQNELNDYQSITDANKACEVLVNTFTRGINMFSKNIKPSRRKTPIKPWISPGILCSINRKNKLYKKFIQNRNIRTESIYKKYRNTLTCIIREAKKSYFKNAFTDSRGNGKQTWKLLREALNARKQQNKLPNSFIREDGSICTEDHVADAFNDFFTSVAQKLEDEMPASDNSPIDYLSEIDYAGFDDALVTTVLEIEDIIKSLNHVGGGMDKIATKILLATYKNCIHHLTYFFNLCLSTSTFPDCLKVALVVPIYKSGDKNKFTNYRPISLLPLFSKVLEKILYKYVATYLDRYNILQNLQFGFRKKHSTYMPVALMVDEITKALEKNEKVLGLYLDLKKAFDTVNIEILLKKLNSIGFRGNLLKIIQSYFENRTQRVQANSDISEHREVRLGVPQGSILGPLLFIIYINDIVSVSNEVSFYLFADDTAIIMKGKTCQDIQSQMDNFIPRLMKWFQCNRLTLNPSKSCYQLYSLSSNQRDIDIRINNDKIKRCFTVKYLGILVDENLKWESHINYVCKKISRNIGIMGRVRYYLSPKELSLLYNAIVLPHLNYCAVIWGSAYQTRLQKIVILQKRAVRIIDHKPFRFPSHELFIKYNVLKFPDLVIEQNIVILKSFLNDTLPIPMKDMFHINRPLNTRAPDQFIIPFSRCNYRTSTLSFTAPRAWNSVVGNMYQQLRDIPSKPVLKKHVRARILDTYIGRD